MYKTGFGVGSGLGVGVGVGPSASAVVTSNVMALRGRLKVGIDELLKRMVARDGIEPPTPAFSGPRSTD